MMEWEQVGLSEVNSHRLEVGGFGFRLKVDLAAKAA